MDPEFERRLSKPNSGCIRAMSNGIVASPMSPNTTPTKGTPKGVRSSPATPMSSPSLRRSLFKSPASSPNKERYGDRFIPVRNGNTWETNFSNIPEKSLQSAKKGNAANTTRDANEGTKDHSLLVYSSLLRNEILGAQIEDFKELSNIQDERVKNSNVVNGQPNPNSIPYAPTAAEQRNLFTYKARRMNIINEPTSPYSLTPISAKSVKLLRSPRKASRKISKIPFKVLDAPELQDDFYLNLVDWSSQNVLSVGLGACVYLWSACTSQVTKLCDLTQDGDTVTSVSWSERGNFVAVGTHRGYVQVWDVMANKRVNVLEGHTARVGALAWNGDNLSSGSRDRLILQRDVRTPPLASERRLVGHRQEVCGLKWSPDNQYLASGGNDNKLFVWNSSMTQPVHTFTEHLAAVKAIAWSPHHHGLLASGGGTADRCIRFWNTLTGQAVQSVDTGSQVCNLAWSKHSSELVSTHGYSQNQILVWKYPSLVQVAKLTGHHYRVLYLAMSPDGEAIVTGAGDETLRFWNVFSKARSQKEAKSALNLFTSIR